MAQEDDFTSNQEFGVIEVKKGLERISHSPFIEADNLTAFIDPRDGVAEVRIVPVEKIISAPFMKDWGDLDRDPGYLTKMITDLRSGKLDLSKIELPRLNDYGGGFLVSSDGRTRSAVAKIEKLNTMPALVKNTIPGKVVVFKEEDYEVVYERLKSGLWRGNIQPRDAESLRNWGIDFYASGEIIDYEGVWVFARDMDKAKAVYESIGASGKATL